jgi:hypothetical protein
MNSKQLNFFIHPSDQDEIDSFLTKEGVLIIKQPGLNKKLTLNSSIHKNMHEFNKVYLTKDLFIDTIQQNYITNMNYFLIDDIRSEVVELSRGSLNNESLKRSRFYYVTGYFGENGRQIQKNLQFINWADLLVKNFKKKFLSKSDDGNFYSKNALDWRRINKATLHKSGLTLDMPRKKEGD